MKTLRTFMILATVLVPTAAAAQDLVDLSTPMPDSLLTREPYAVTLIDREELERMGSLSVTEILTLQSQVFEMKWFDNVKPGFYERGFQQIHLRGGRHAETAFLIDGDQATNLLFGVPLPLGPPQDYESLVILPGGLGAEHGYSLSGVVNLVTRGPKTSSSGAVEVRTSEFSGTRRDPLRDETVVRAWSGGMLPLSSDTHFFLSGQADTRRDFLVLRDPIIFDLDPDPAVSGSRDPRITYDETDPYQQWGPDGRRIHPMDIHSGWLPMGFGHGWDGLVKLSRKLGVGGLDLSWIRRGFMRAPYTFNWRYSMLWGQPEEYQRHLTMGTLRYDAEGLGDLIDQTGIVSWENEKNIVTEDDHRFALRWQHRVSPDLRYRADLIYSVQHRRQRVHRWVNEQGYHSDRRLFDPVSGTGDWTPDDAMERVVLQPFPYSSSSPEARRYGYSPWYSVYLGYQGSDRYYETSSYTYRGLRVSMDHRIAEHHRLKAGVTYARLTLDSLEHQILFYDNPYSVDYREPLDEYAFYLSDRIELGHLTMDLGVRYEAFRQEPAPFWVDPRDPTDPTTGLVVHNPWDPDFFEDPGATRAVDPIRHMLSPRIGLAHPIGNRAVVFGNWGVYQKPPVYRNVYLEGTLTDAVPLIGNRDLLPERNSQAEIGMRTALDDVLRLQSVLWVKDASQLVTTERIPAWFQGVPNPYTYTVYLNYDYLLARGVDLTLSKRLKNGWSARLTYTFMRSEANRDDPWEGYRQGETLQTMPKRVRPVGWDTPHRVGAELTWLVPEGGGPLMKGLRPLERTSLLVIYRGQAGRPYTPTTRTTTGERNSARMPWSHRFDLLGSKGLRLMGLECSLLVTVRNLFDRRNVLTVFSRTGSPEDPGAGATSYSDSYDRWHHYGTPRFIDLGLRISF